MTLLAMERNRPRRKAWRNATRRTAEKLKAELQDVGLHERTLQSQRERERITLLDSNQKMLLLVGIVAGVGLLAMLLASIFHLRAMKGFTVIASRRAPGGRSVRDRSIDGRGPHS